MEKIKIFIDFEAISESRFYFKGTKFTLPYAYSIGRYIGKKFVIKTHIMEFDTKNINKLIAGFKIKLMRDILTLDHNKPSDIFDISRYEFIAWSGDLERLSLGLIFRKSIPVTNLNGNSSVSLERISSLLMEKKVYFPHINQILGDENNDVGFCRKYHNRSGAIASLVGYTLFMGNSVGNGYKGFSILIDKKKCVTELTQYSKDDVYRMHLVHEEGEEWFLKTFNKILRKRNELKAVQKAKKEYINAALVVKKEEFKGMSIGEIIEFIDSKIENLDEKIMKLTSEKDKI